MNIQHIIPAIIPETLDLLQRRLREVRGAAHRVQIDIMDGTFTKAVSWPYGTADREAFEAIRREDEGLPYWQEFDFEIDMMVREPEKRIEEWALAGATTLIIHVGSTERLADIVAQCRERRVEVACAVKPETDLAVLAPYIEELAFIQCMGSNRIGQHGIALDPAVPGIIRSIRERWPGIPVGVDIGVREDTLPALIDAGATRFAVGSAIFNTNDPAREWQHLESYAATSCAAHERGAHS